MVNNTIFRKLDRPTQSHIVSWLKIVHLSFHFQNLGDELFFFLYMSFFGITFLSGALCFQSVIDEDRLVCWITCDIPHTQPVKL